MLQIHVYGDDRIAGGSIQSGGERRLFSEIPRQRQQLDRNGVRLRRRRDLVTSRVARSVVDKKDVQLDV
jgi:hypothetical protein